MTYAVVKTGGKQYRVEQGQLVQVDKLPNQVGDQVELSQVLLVCRDQAVLVGKPTVEGARVVGTVMGEVRSRKRLTMKYRPKQRYRRKLGHRQTYTMLRIDEIMV